MEKDPEPTLSTKSATGLVYDPATLSYKADVKTDPKDSISVIVGDDKDSSKVYSQLKLSRWSNEVNTSIRFDIPGDEDEIVTQDETGSVIIEKGNISVRMYERDDFLEGASEFEIRLSEKPKSSTFSFSVNTKELDWFYQPELTQEEIDEGEVRPNNVIGSYAVYHKTKGGLNDSAGMEYKTGKAFHSYRPEAIDADGNKVWCEFNKDVQDTGILTVTVPDKFLDRAVYPVIVDPTFGYTSIGASTTGTSGINCSIFTSPADAGTVTSLSIVDYTSSGTDQLGGAIYTDSSNDPDTKVAEDSGDVTVDTDVDFSTVNINASISPNTPYWLCGWADAANNYRHDAGDANQRARESTSSFQTWPSSMSTVAFTARKLSIYATYTAEEGTTTSTTTTSTSSSTSSSTTSTSSSTSSSTTSTSSSTSTTSTSSSTSTTTTSTSSSTSSSTTSTSSSTSSSTTSTSSSTSSSTTSTSSSTSTTSTSSSTSTTTTSTSSSSSTSTTTSLPYQVDDIVINWDSGGTTTSTTTTSTSSSTSSSTTSTSSSSSTSSSTTSTSSSTSTTTLPGNSITLTDLVEGRIYQRNDDDEASVTITGTYEGTPTSIQARIVGDGTSTEVVTWTTIVASPADEVFSGEITVPQGGWYNVQVRFGNDTGVIDEGTNGWGVGILFGCIGQSNIYYWFSQSTDLTPNPLLRRYDELGWGTETHNGAIAFSKKITDVLNIPVGLVNYSLGGTALLQTSDSGSGYWLDTANNSVYDKFIDGVTAIGGKLEFVLWNQGENEIQYGTVTKSAYQSGLDTLFDRVRAAITYGKTGTMPILMAHTGRYQWGDDTKAQVIHDAQYTYSKSEVYLAATTMDLAQADEAHFTGASYTIMGQRFAQTVLYVLGEETYYRGPTVTSYTQSSGTELDVFLTHSGGSDFTPTSSITGFLISDGGGNKTITGGIRIDATTIRLTVSSSFSGSVTLKYFYGENPTITGAVHDNTTMSLPLEWMDGVTESITTTSTTSSTSTTTTSTSTTTTSTSSSTSTTSTSSSTSTTSTSSSSSTSSSTTSTSSSSSTTSTSSSTSTTTTSTSSSSSTSSSTTSTSSSTTTTSTSTTTTSTSTSSSTSSSTSTTTTSTSTTTTSTSTSSSTTTTLAWKPEIYMIHQYDFSMGVMRRD